MRIRSFVAILTLASEAVEMVALPVGPHEHANDWIAQPMGPLSLFYRPRLPSSKSSSLTTQTRRLVLGDDSESDESGKAANLAHAVTLEYDPAGVSLTVHTSIVGLPPVFVFKNTRCVILVSDPFLLTGVAGLRLEIDPIGVEQLARIGFPINHRTLFKNTELVPSGARVRLGKDLALRIEPTWYLPEAPPVDWRTFVEIQSAAFIDALQRIDVSRSFLSLSGGLDTRTIFAALTAEHRTIPAVTMTGAHASVDARISSSLCRAAGVRHRLITFDERFTRDLPAYVERASRLSGGLEGLKQATEVYLYDQLGSEFTARLSGNLGNQVGRAGTERIRLRNAPVTLLSGALLEHANDERKPHWLLTQLDHTRLAAHTVLLQQEIPFTSVGNFCVGSHFVTQQTPYANRRLLETLSVKPPARQRLRRTRPLHLRIHDLRHRFLGQPARTSFQRSLVKQLGGISAAHPINYGWRIAGHPSPTGWLLGAAAIVGVLAEARRLDSDLLRALLLRTGVSALHDFRQPRLWLLRYLKEFTYDLLTARAVATGGLLNSRTLQVVLDEHFSGKRDHYDAVSFALEVVLAERLFCLTPPVATSVLAAKTMAPIASA